ncbi:MAG: hypothetical protein R3B95_02630 [Nitrospirales bacterium]|nr:hypothetical protein [Nitrospirales bacterium]
MTNQRKWLVLGGLLLAWGMVTVFQMWDSGQTDPMPYSDTSGSPLPPLKDLELDPEFPNPRQTAKFSQPRNIFAPLGTAQVARQEKAPPPFLAFPKRPLPHRLPHRHHQALLLPTLQDSGPENNSTTSGFWGI